MYNRYTCIGIIHKIIKMRRRIFKIALFGIQGAGKGTQGKHITEIFGIPSVSPGTMFRKEVKEETELGKFVRPYLEA